MRKHFSFLHLGMIALVFFTFHMISTCTSGARKEKIQRANEAAEITRKEEVQKTREPTQEVLRQTTLLAQALGSETIPEVQVKPQPNSSDGSELYRKNYAFSKDWFTERIPVWRAVLAPYVNKPDLSYLEIGVFEGRSLIWMAEHVLTDPSSRFTAIDPFMDQFTNNQLNSEEYDKTWFKESNVESVFRKNIALCGIEKQVDVIKGFSQIEMQKLPFEEYDIIYVDGSHRTRAVLEDAILSMWRLKKGGLLIFDDYEWRKGKNSTPFPAVNLFYALYRENLEVVHKGYQVVFRKKGGSETK